MTQGFWETGWLDQTDGQSGHRPTLESTVSLSAFSLQTGTTAVASLPAPSLREQDRVPPHWESEATCSSCTPWSWPQESHSY